MWKPSRPGISRYRGIIIISLRSFLLFIFILDSSFFFHHCRTIDKDNLKNQEANMNVVKVKNNIAKGILKAGIFFFSSH